VAEARPGLPGCGVALVKDEAALGAYLRNFPAGARLLLQKYVPFEGEAGIFYCRHPHAPKGRIASITLKYFPYAYGDGTHTLRELILADRRAGRCRTSTCDGTSTDWMTYHRRAKPSAWPLPAATAAGPSFETARTWATPEMAQRFDEISQRLPEFYFGRYDIRFADFEAVRKGQDFTIVEVNGAGAESTHIWDRNTSPFKAWTDLFKQYKLLFQIGRANFERGFKPLSLAEFRRWHQRRKQLTPLYPPTDEPELD